MRTAGSRLKTGIIVALAAAGVYVSAERLAGPRVQAMPASLPYAVRRPPTAPSAWDSAVEPVNPPGAVRRLHAQGITGRGIGIAVIDSFLLTEHREFRDRLRWYDEVDGEPGDAAGWHGTATASIAAGQTVGMAPEADLYFVGIGAIWSNQPNGSIFAMPRRGIHAGQHQALAIRRVLDINSRLPADRKIRAISMAVGWGPRGLRGETEAAVAAARRAGMFVSAQDGRYAPFGPVKIASAANPERYVVVGAAPSWAIAYWAGRYALACQQDASTTPERFAAIIAGEASPASARDRMR